MNLFLGQYINLSYVHAWRMSEPEPIIDERGLGAFEKPRCFERLVWRALGEELISPVRAAQLLKLPLGFIEGQIRGKA